MRPGEALFAVVLTIALVAGATGLSRRWPPARHLAPLPVVAAGVQAVLEGYRWQLVPAYVVASVLAVQWLVGRGLGPRATRPTGRRRRWLRVVSRWLIVVVGAVASVAPLLIFPVFTIPAPSGPYAVGTTTYHWVDAARPDAFVPDPAARRELMVQVWYPARAVPDAPHAAYLPDPGVLGPLARLLRLPAFVFDHLRYARTNAQLGVPVADGSARFPVLVCAHGRGGFRQEDTWLVEELVSFGYVVACMDQPHAASGVDLPGGRRVPLDPRMMGRRFVDAMVPYLAQDASFTLDQLAQLDAATSGPLAGQLDLARVGMFGLSLGGQVTAQACHQDRRFAACLMMDVWMPADVVASGLRQPCLFLTRDAATMRAEGWGSADIDDTLTSMRAVFRSLSGRGWFVSAPGMYHQDFSDAPLVSPLTRALGVTGPVTPSRAHAITTGYTLGFFDATLRNRPSPLLAGTARPFPEVTVDRR